MCQYFLRITGGDGWGTLHLTQQISQIGLRELKIELGGLGLRVQGLGFKVELRIVAR